MARILIEFFCEENAENVTPFLYGSFDHAYYMYFDKERPGSRTKEVLSELLSEKFGVQSSFVFVNGYSLTAAVYALSSVIHSENEYVIDLTGGSELFSAAAGIYLGTSDAKNVTAVSFDIKNGRGYRQYPDYAELKMTGSFGLHDLIRMYGGEIVSSYKMSDAVTSGGRLRSETIRMWNAVKGYIQDWNRFCSMQNRRSGRLVTKRLTRADDKRTCERVTSSLKHKGMIKNVHYYLDDRNRTFIEYELSDRTDSYELYEKSGSALEMYTFFAVCECGSFSSAATSVTLDLDGLITKRRGDPRNEIDVMAVYRNTPVLISCKCTKPTKEYLYEILTMAEQYGGKYAAPVLVSSEPAFEPVRERAKEMGVILIDNAAYLPLKRIKELLSSYFPSDT